MHIEPSKPLDFVPEVQRGKPRPLEKVPRVASAGENMLLMHHRNRLSCKGHETCKKAVKGAGIEA